MQQQEADQEHKDQITELEIFTTDLCKNPYLKINVVRASVEMAKANRLKWLPLYLYVWSKAILANGITVCDDCTLIVFILKDTFKVSLLCVGLIVEHDLFLTAVPL